MTGRTRLPAHIRQLIPAAERQAPKPKRQPSTGNGILARAGVGSELELALLTRILRSGLPEPVKQFRFCPTRRWHSDFAYPRDRLLIEVDGGAWVQGRHTRGAGFEEDCVKLSTAAALGYRVLRFTKRHIANGQAISLIAAALGVKESTP